MKKLFIYLLVLLSLSIKSYSQKLDYQWVFGDSCGIDFSILSSPVTYLSGAHNMYENFASIADDQGNLCCYLNGSPLNASNLTFFATVYNKHHVIIVNGDSIYSDYSQTQGSLFIPFPGHPYIYYLFHHQLDTNNTYPSYRTSLYYSIIDMAAYNGIGQVISKNNVLIQHNSQEKLCGVKHGNGRDWWIIIHQSASSNFKMFLLTPWGITDTITQSIGPYIPGSGLCYSMGQMKFSQKGDKLALVNKAGELSVYNFDRCTGSLASFRSVFSGTSNCSRFYGCSFSPSGKYLYTADNANIYQYDLTSTNIATSEYIVWQDTITLPGYFMGQEQLGPDDKIYISCLTGFPISNYRPHRQSLSVINNPDMGGAGCNFIPFSFNLNGGETSGGLPNMCNYNLGPESGCDSLVSVEPIDLEKIITIYPDPANDRIKIDCQSIIQGEIKICDVLSHEIYSCAFENHSATLDISNLATGVYFLIIETKKRIVVRKIIKE